MASRYSQESVRHGRERLRCRLVRHGLAPSAALLGSLLSADAASAAVPGALVETTARTATFLAAGQALTRSSRSGVGGGSHHKDAQSHVLEQTDTIARRRVGTRGCVDRHFVIRTGNNSGSCCREARGPAAKSEAIRTDESRFDQSPCWRKHCGQRIDWRYHG